MRDSENGLYLMLGEIKGDIRSVLNRMDNITKSHAEAQEHNEKRLNSHSARLTVLEQFRWKVAGIVLVIPVVIAVGGWYVNRMG